MREYKIVYLNERGSVVSYKEDGMIKKAPTPEEDPLMRSLIESPNRLSNLGFERLETKVTIR